MKRFMTVMLLMALFLAMALAQEEQSKAKQPAPQMRGMGGMGMMMHRQQGGPGAPMGLGVLTPEQQTKMQDLRLAHQKEMLPLHTQLQKLQGDLKLEITADKVNESKAKSIQGEISKVSAELAGKKFAHMRAMRDILTAEQKKKFDERVLSGGMMGPGPQGSGAMMDRGKGIGQRGMMGPGGMKGRVGMMGARGMRKQGGCSGVGCGCGGDCPMK
jgi:Spy/CpxP family protein refolding chaperone